MKEQHIMALLWFFIILMIIPALALYEAVTNFIKDANHNRKRVQDLNQQNYELRDEIARLTRQR